MKARQAQAAVLRRLFRSISALLSANNFMVLRARVRRAGQIQRSKRIQATITHRAMPGQRRAYYPLFVRLPERRSSASVAATWSNRLLSAGPSCTDLYAFEFGSILPYRGTRAERSWPLTTGRKTSGRARRRRSQERYDGSRPRLGRSSLSLIRKG